MGGVSKFWFMWIIYLLISQPLITVEQMDDATVVKFRLRQCSLHGFVIPVGVDADVTGLCTFIKLSFQLQDGAYGAG